MRKVLAAVLFVVAGAFLLMGWFALDNLWADYKDSPDSTYIEVAAVEFVLAALALFAGTLALRDR